MQMGAILFIADFKYICRKTLYNTKFGLVKPRSSVKASVKFIKEHVEVRIVPIFRVLLLALAVCTWPATFHNVSRYSVSFNLSQNWIGTAPVRLTLQLPRKIREYYFEASFTEDCMLAIRKMSVTYVALCISKDRQNTEIKTFRIYKQAISVDR